MLVTISAQRSVEVLNNRFDHLMAGPIPEAVRAEALSAKTQVAGGRN